MKTTTAQLAAAGLPLDEEGRVIGFAVGKEMRIAEWRAKKEQQEYDRLFARLYQRNWARKKRAEDPEAAMAKCQAWRDANRERHRATERDRRRRKRVEADLSCTCEECGKVWKLIDGARPGRFCSRKCRNRFTGRKRTHEGRRRKGLRNMQIVDQILTVLRRTPMTAKQVAEALPDANPRSISVKLSLLEKEGKLASVGKRSRIYEVIR